MTTVPIAAEDQPFSEEHNWKATRYAGVFMYLIALITENKWLKLVMGYCGARVQGIYGIYFNGSLQYSLH